MRGARAKIELMQRDFETWEAVTVGADYPEQA